MKTLYFLFAFTLLTFAPTKSHADPILGQDIIVNEVSFQAYADTLGLLNNQLSIAGNPSASWSMTVESPYTPVHYATADLNISGHNSGSSFTFDGKVHIHNQFDPLWYPQHVYVKSKLKFTVVGQETTLVVGGYNAAFSGAHALTAPDATLNTFVQTAGEAQLTVTPSWSTSYTPSLWSPSGTSATGTWDSHSTVETHETQFTNGYPRYFKTYDMYCVDGDFAGWFSTDRFETHPECNEFGPFQYSAGNSNVFTLQPGTYTVEYLTEVHQSIWNRNSVKGLATFAGKAQFDYDFRFEYNN